MPRPAAPRPRFQVTELEARLTPAGDLFVTPSADTAGGPVQLRFEWGASDAQFRNEFGFFNVDDADGRISGHLPSDSGYASLALDRAQVVLAKGAGFGAKAEVTTAGGQLLGFYLVSNATTLEARQTGATVFFSFDGANADRLDHVRTVDRGDGGKDFRFEDQFGGGDGDFDDAIVSVARTHAVATPGQPGQTVQANFARLARSAGLEGEVGVYKVDGRSGSVGGILPGAAGYLQAALGSATRQTIFSAGSPETERSLTLDGGSLYGFYFLTSGTAQQLLTGGDATAYFSFSDANPDRLDHIDWRSADTFGVEDQLGGGDKDFDDGVFRFTFGRPQGTPTATPEPIPEPTPEPTPTPTPTPSPTPEPTPTPTDTTAPNAAFRLTTDSGTSNSDLITNNAEGVLTVIDIASEVVTLRAGFDSSDAATYADILSRRATDGTVTVDAALLTVLNRGTVLPNGPHTLFVQAADAAGNSQVFQFAVTLDDTSPTASYTFNTDSGASNSDRITNDATGVLVVNDSLSSIATLRAGFGTADIDILSRRAANGAVTVDAALLTLLNHGVPLSDGPRTLLVQATDAAGNQNTFQFPFTLDTTGAPSFDLAAASDTGTVGDLRTEAATVTLAGTAAPAGAVLELTIPVVPGTPGAGAVLATATAAADGTFSFANVALNVGPNSYSVRAVSGTDVAGNAAGIRSETIVRNTPPTVANAIADQSATAGGADLTFDLATVFADAERVLRFATTRPGGLAGNIDIHLFATQAPATVANILAYVNSANAQQDFDGSIFHRLAPGFVLQGGGFNFDPAGTDTATTFPAIPDFAAVVNEPGVSNTRGTIAMAKLSGNPNSATNEFFFNLNDNAANLDAQNGGFTVFGQVMNGGQQTLDAVTSSVTTFSGSGLPGAAPFPIRNGADTTNFPLNVVAGDLATISAADELTAAQRMTFAVASNTNSAAATATVVGNTLTVDPLAVGTTTITVRATDLDGSVVTTSFTVTVS